MTLEFCMMWSINLLLLIFNSYYTYIGLEGIYKITILFQIRLVIWKEIKLLAKYKVSINYFNLSLSTYKISIRSKNYKNLRTWNIIHTIFYLRNFYLIIYLQIIDEYPLSHFNNIGTDMFTFFLGWYFLRIEK